MSWKLRSLCGWNRLPNAITTSQTRVNDKLYIGVFYDRTVKSRNITLEAQIYTVQYFANQLEILMNFQINTTEVEFNLTYKVDRWVISINTNVKRISKPGVMLWQILSDDKLKAGFFCFNNFAPTNNPTTCNALIQNYVVNPNTQGHDQIDTVDYNVDYTLQEIYIC